MSVFVSANPAAPMHQLERRQVVGPIPTTSNSTALSTTTTTPPTTSTTTTESSTTTTTTVPPVTTTTTEPPVVPTDTQSTTTTVSSTTASTTTTSETAAPTNKDDQKQGENNGQNSTQFVIIMSIVIVSVIGIAVGVYIFRKWLLPTSKDFKRRRLGLDNGTTGRRPSVPNDQDEDWDISPSASDAAPSFSNAPNGRSTPDRANIREHLNASTPLPEDSITNKRPTLPNVEVVGPYAGYDYYAQQQAQAQAQQQQWGQQQQQPYYQQQGQYPPHGWQPQQ
ncbi:hypothetical protein HDU97_005500 [Phlyctochytrium planicorne]|nr:hypothetical protein HDU97_005500 [Phlyctochytrium planicorne]